MNSGVPGQLIGPVEPLSTADPGAGKRQDVAVGDEVSSEVACLGILAPAAGHMTVVLASSPLGIQGAVGADARASPEIRINHIVTVRAISSMLQGPQLKLIFLAIVMTGLCSGKRRLRRDVWRLKLDLSLA